MAGAKDNLFGGTAYQPQGEAYFDDGREIELLHFMYAHPHLNDMRGNPQKVLDAIDEYGKTRKYLMNIGEYKSKTVIDLIREEKPKVIVELGGYVGYSAIAFGAALKNIGGNRYYSLEMNPEFAAVISMLVDLAGLSDIVKVVVGPSSDSLKRLFKEGTLNHIDLLFLDHYKPAYTPDLKTCEELGLVSKGSIYAADNVIKPGNPVYLQYVRSTVQEKRQNYLRIDSSSPRGNPDLIYDSQLIEGWEPSGVPDAIEITRCIGIEA
ncbi:S-adenosyl-L-methionine-dependent methyltransferase [Annulohypoxylon truncatum]|uniref:S-adenosyl-L-methionine-dependent methyltransferase n=1 Tax=Annulohypoxylon truncatum TaxID=327061 RepID=UPI0020072F70|nr:S-adenosyl-L-methionine-dependent methyltransferase [Annulohypoxylon truncatum]KAI1208034.1 S-adenosyl-L-methionine-dependent methyltransferase [Annulohypoxylon truncatum]